jgi:hypothetical protein
VSTTSGYFNTNPRGVVFLKPLIGETSQLGTLTSTFQVSLVPDGDAINITSTISGTFQVANQSRTFAGNNINPLTQTVIDIEVGSTFNFDGGNQGYSGAVIPTNPPNNTLTVNSYDGTAINAEGSSASDHYVGSMVRYTSSGSAATGLTANATYFITSFTNNGLGNYTFSVAALPGGTPISIPSGSGSGTQAFSKIGISLDRDIVHIKDAGFAEGDMLEYSFPVDGRFEVIDEEQEKIFYFVDTVYDTHNYKLGEDIGFKPIVATGGTLLPEIFDKGRFWRVHQFTATGSSNFVVSDIGKEGIIEYLVVGGGGSGGPRGGGGGAGGMLEGTFTVTETTYPIVVGAGGAQSTDSATGGSGNNGQNSSAFGVTANGGGAGGIFTAAGSNGASGGGAGRDNPVTAATSTGIAGQGYPGGGGSGNPAAGNPCSGAGGGGGAGGPGQRGRTNLGGPFEFLNEQELGGNGGLPRASNITGTRTYYAGGGGGGAACVGAVDELSLRSGLGGGISSNLQKGGGGDGSNTAGNTPIPRTPTAGAPNTGGGGGGGSDNNGFAGGVNTGAPGGSGVVIVRYPITPPIEAFTPGNATGGTVSETLENGILYKVHTFSTVGASTFTVLDTGSWNKFEYLVVGGGGNGDILNTINASIANGGGGGGGVRQGNLELATGVGYAVNVGGATQTSTFATITSAAGGNGSNGSGASGGGGQSHQGVPSNTGPGGQGNVPVTSPPQGFNGGAGYNAGASGSPERGGGGGGAGAPGRPGVVAQAGDGGSGQASFITGGLAYYGGGGGGSTRSASLGIDVRFGLGGQGGGGDGANGTSARAPSGLPNTGGGGGAYTSFGGTNSPATQAGAGFGGSGIVVVRYPIAIQTPGEYIIASGGTVSTTIVGSVKYAVHRFREIGNSRLEISSISSNSARNQLEYIVVAGGGGGATDVDVGGGGGAGGFRSGTLTATVQSYPVVVGQGGMRGSGPDGTGVGGGGNGGNGQNSTFASITSLGGGGGGTRDQNGLAGGSGGGGGDASRPGGAGTAGQGFAGGAGPGMNSNNGRDSGGGGGAGGAGNGNQAGPGVASSITGSSVTYAAGGVGSQNIALVAGAPNTGNGGNGARPGGSGIVIVRYPIGAVG